MKQRIIALEIIVFLVLLLCFYSFYFSSFNVKEEGTKPESCNLIVSFYITNKNAERELTKSYNTDVYAGTIIGKTIRLFEIKTKHNMNVFFNNQLVTLPDLYNLKVVEDSLVLIELNYAENFTALESYYTFSFNVNLTDNNKIYYLSVISCFLLSLLLLLFLNVVYIMVSNKHKTLHDFIDCRNE